MSVLPPMTITPANWGKCQVCGQLADWIVMLCYCQLRADGSMYEPSFRRMPHPYHPFLCEAHRQWLRLPGEATVTPPDAKGNVRVIYPFSREGWFLSYSIGPGHPSVLALKGAVGKAP